MTENRVTRREGLWFDMKGGHPMSNRHVDRMLLNTVNLFGIGSYVYKQLQNGADVNTKNSTGETALMIAAAKGYAPVVELLLDNGADVNATSCDGITPLMCAVRGHNVDSVCLMLRYGAATDSADGKGRTAAMFAMGCEIAVKRQILDKLVEASCNLRKADDTGMTLLMSYCHMCHNDSLGDLVHILSVLLHCNNINAKDENGNTALMFLCQDRGWVDNVAMMTLLDNGADINAQNNDGLTALMFASMFMTFYDVEYLLERGADVNAQDINGQRVLDKIDFEEKICVAKVLLSAGAAVNFHALYTIPALTEEWVRREKRKLCLKLQCRKIIRSHIAVTCPKHHVDNLIPRLGLPKQLHEYVATPTNS